MIALKGRFCQFFFMTTQKPRIRAMFGSSVGAAGVHNRRVVIDAIRVNGPLSRAALARATKLAKQTLSNIIEDLEKEGIVVPCETVRGGRGKPATPYALAPHGAFAVGLQIDRHIARCIAVNLVGDILVRRETKLCAKDPDSGLETLAELVARTRADLTQRIPCSQDRVVGLGVAMPGPFGRNCVLEDDEYTMARWQDFPLTERLEAATGLSVSLQNDAAAATTAEKLIGHAHGLRNSVCIYLGYGLGAGLILNGELFVGEGGNAGEIGLIASPHGTCAQAPLEHSVSLASFCEVAGLDPSAPDLFPKIESRLSAPDAAIEAWLEQAARQLDWLADLLDLIFSPQLIVLCGTAPADLIARLIAMVETRRGEGGSPRLLGRPLRSLDRGDRRGGRADPAQLRSALLGPA